jgi:hypothetical protein
LTSSLLDVRRGSQTPRVANYPPYAVTEALDVIDLAASAGLHLDEWQQYVLTHGLGTDLSGQWTARKVSTWVPRQNGKGSVIEALELAWLFLYGEELIVHSSHQHRTSARAYRRLELIIRRAPHLLKKVKQFRQANGEQQIELFDGRMLQYTTRSASAIRGFSAGKIVLDEAQELNSDQMAAILPAVSAMPNWQVWFFGTPPNDPEAWAYGLRSDGELGTARLAHFDWGADLNPTKPADRERAKDRDLWYACNPALGGRIEVETVEDECKPSGLGDRFAIERLGAWLPQLEGGALLDPTLWAKMRAEGAKRVGDLTLSVDVTPLLDHGSIGLYCPTGGFLDESGDLVPTGREHVQLVDYREGVDWIPGRLAELVEVLDPIAVVLDHKNGAHAMLDAIREAWLQRCEETGRDPGLALTVPDDPEQPRRGQILVMETQDVVDAVGQFVQAFRSGAFQHVGQAPLDSAIKNVKPRQIGDSGQIAYGRKASEVDIGPAQVVTQGRYGHRAWADLVTSDYDVLDSVF